VEPKWGPRGRGEDANGGPWPPLAPPLINVCDKIMIENHKKEKLLNQRVFFNINLNLKDRLQMEFTAMLKRTIQRQIGSAQTVVLGENTSSDLIELFKMARGLSAIPLTEPLLTPCGEN